MGKNLFIALLALGSSAFAQSTAVTATITDANSQTWNNASYTITFVPQTGTNPNAYSWQGAPLPSSDRQFTGTLSGSGVLTATIPDTNQITPTTSQWKFTICPLASTTQCQVVTTVVTGASEDLSSVLSANLAAPSVFPTGMAYAYQDSDMLALPGQGQFYFNVVSGVPRYFNGTSWAVIGGSSTCPTCVLAVSPGVGIAHFAGSTQTVTSSPVNLAGGATEVTGILPIANLPAPSVSETGGDIACAVANDLTIGQRTITGGSSTASTITVSGASGFNNGYYVGEVINVQGASPAGFNAAGQTVTALTSNTGVTFSNASNPGAWSSGGTLSKTCGNQTNDAIAATPYTFSNKFTVPANFMAAGLNVDAQAQFLSYVPTANPAGITSIKLFYGASTVYQNLNALVMATNAAPTVPYGGMLSWTLTGINTTTAANNLRSSTLPTTSAPDFVSNANSVQMPATGLTTSATTLGPAIVYAATGVASSTYVSGGSFSGTGSCGLATFATCTGTTGTIAVTSGAAGAITITARGAACTAATTAALSNGTATCSGTATITSVLGGSPGNATELLTFTVKQN